MTPPCVPVPPMERSGRMSELLHSLWRRMRDESGILLVFLALAALGLFFLKLASEVTEGETLGFDRAIMQWMRDRAGGPAMRTTMLDITALGGTVVLTLITLAVTGYLVMRRKAATAGFLLASIVGGAIVSFGLKLIFARPRPDLVEHMVFVDTSSFPSGHAANSAVVYLTLGMLLAGTQERHGSRIYLMAIAVALTLAIGVSRVYLGVHWPSDVLAGWCVGAVWAGLCGVAAYLLQRRRQIEPPGDAS